MHVLSGIAAGGAADEEQVAAVALLLRGLLRLTHSYIQHTQLPVCARDVATGAWQNLVRNLYLCNRAIITMPQAASCSPNTQSICGKLSFIIAVATKMPVDGVLWCLYLLIIHSKLKLPNYMYARCAGCPATFASLPTITQMLTHQPSAHTLSIVVLCPCCSQL